MKYSTGVAPSMADGAYKRFWDGIKTDINLILELGSRDALDAIEMHQRFNCPVVAWECNPVAIELCKRNIGLNQDITLVEKAVWSEPGIKEFHPVTNGNLGASSMFKANSRYPYEQYEQDTIEVECMRVDDWLNENDVQTPELLCMDLQGSELEALESLGDRLYDVHYIITEGQWMQLYHNTPYIGDIMLYLKEFGFEARGRVDVNEWFGDFLFVNARLIKES